MNDTPLLVSSEGAISTLTLNRPHAGNTIDLPLACALLDAATACDNDPAVRCVVLTGAGKLFCGGGDLAGFAAAGDKVPEYLLELAGTLHLAIARLMRMAKRGWSAPSWPGEYGGGGLDPDRCEILRQQLDLINARPPLISFPLWMLGPTLLEFGSEQQKRLHLPRIARGETRWCQGYSEPEYGSDLAGVPEDTAEDQVVGRIVQITII